jgi:hypothetical protein
MYRYMGSDLFSNSWDRTIRAISDRKRGAHGDIMDRIRTCTRPAVYVGGVSARGIASSLWARCGINTLFFLPGRIEFEHLPSRHSDGGCRMGGGMCSTAVNDGTGPEMMRIAIDRNK